MTNDEARTILKACDEWVAWDTKTDSPQWDFWSGNSCSIDGKFTAQELRALLHFAPKVTT